MISKTTVRFSRIRIKKQDDLKVKWLLVTELRTVGARPD